MVFSFVFMTDSNRPAIIGQALRQLPPGSWVVLRCFAHEAGDASRYADLRRLCRERRLIFIVSSFLRLAQVLKADGLHLPENTVKHGVLAKEKLWLRQGRRRFSVSAHSLPALARAAQLSPDIVFLSPVFATNSHLGDEGLGALRFLSWRKRFPKLQVLPLGGMSKNSLKRFGPARPSGAAFASLWKT